MAEIISHNANELTIQVTVKLSGSLLDMENAILGGCNKMGCLATTEALQKFDTYGSPLKLGDTKRRTVFEYIETDYNPVRLHSTNGFITQL